MKIGIIGTGHVGGALGGRWARSGHEIIFGSRDPQGEKAQNLLRLVSGNVRVTGTTEAVSAAEVVLLATPWSATRDTLDRAGSTNLAGKVVIDAVNPIGPDGLLVGGNTSAAEHRLRRRKAELVLVWGRRRGEECRGQAGRRARFRPR
jgi:predicted dinucleotide-binding enzyme